MDGNNSLGAVVGNFAMQLAISKARAGGVGWVTVRGSNHFGIAGHYSQQALAAGMLGLAFTNGSPYVAPTRSATSTMSTLPISLAAPGTEGGNSHISYTLTQLANSLYLLDLVTLHLFNTCQCSIKGVCLLGTHFLSILPKCDLGNL